MKTEEKTDVQPSENAEEKITPEIDETQTVEGDDAPAGEEADDAKQQADQFYADQLKSLEDDNKRLQEEAEERERQIEIKDRAIQALKKPVVAKKPVSQDDREALKQELLGEVEAKWARKEAERYIQTVTSDTTEREVFLRHYEKLPSKTGDVQKDVLGAIASANAPRILDLLGRGRVEEDSEDRSISAMRGEGVRSPTTRTKTAFEKEVEKMLPKEARKYIKAHIPR